MSSGSNDSACSMGTFKRPNIFNILDESANLIGPFIEWIKLLNVPHIDLCSGDRIPLGNDSFLKTRPIVHGYWLSKLNSQFGP